MVQAMIHIEERTNRVLNIVKAQYGLNDKSQAINHVVQAYEKTLLAPTLKPAYKKTIARIQKGKHVSRKAFDEALHV